VILEEVGKRAGTSKISSSRLWGLGSGDVEARRKVPVAVRRKRCGRDALGALAPICLKHS
jgi:hypothetical protein